MDLSFRERTWGTADGRKVRLMDMDVGHLANVLNWVHDRGELYGDSIKADLISEAQFRQIFAFAESQPYVMLANDNRWQVIDPKTGVGKTIPPPAEYIEATKDNESYQRMRDWVKENRKNLR